MLQLLLKPGLKVFGQLNLSRKFILIFILYLFPVGYTAYYAVTKHKIDIDATQQEISYIRLIDQFKPIFVNMAKSRGLTNAFLNGDSSAQSQIAGIGSLVENQLKFVQSHSAYSDLSNQQKNTISQLSSEWSSLKISATKLTVEESFSKHTDLISKTHNITKSILEQSTLMTDPEVHTSFLINSFVYELPSLIEIAGQTRGMGAGVAAKGEFNSETFIALSNFYKQLTVNLAVVNHSFEGAVKSEPGLSELNSDLANFSRAISNFIETTNSKLLEPDQVSISSQAYFAAGTQAIEKTISLYDATFKSLTKALLQREKNIAMEVWMNILSSIALILGAIYLFACFSQNMLDSINRIKNSVNAVAEGDLTTQVEMPSNDEMKAIGSDINTMVENTKSLVTKVLSATNDLVDTATKNSQSAATTNERINQQNIEVEQVATAMNQMSATVQEVADNAEQTASSTASADKDAKAGYHIVESTTQSIAELAKELEQASNSINELQSDVNSIGSVLDVIQGIADQTNLLALNAAIEAARAGESGRGFAVVADEVRTLASKTQESTEEIRHMIDKLKDSAKTSVAAIDSGNEKSQTTVEDAERAGEALKQISESVGHISLMGEQIASAATEQSTVAEEINRSVMSVKGISELTGEASKESAENSRFLDDIAKNLKTLVAQFKI